ncbi:hypothetical protein HOU02_gp420 [Caulobacter phage CcrBL9]|uniref:Uncharacterized protein n=1 Tax=Caulobacter phage CcrBL9 TaxID=2283270 RepID=A0A385EE63_9CAUD|nr:hypothetical protein HOU02_gp420 [Caulobacter phage CcrBL9]AXQ69305.1 hypothetical protein CcrBL9_gp281 [Caulobacter phage CcrBL9]
MTTPTKPKIKGSKRLARRAAARALYGAKPPAGGYKVKPLPRFFTKPALPSDRVTRIETLTGILEKAAKVQQGQPPFYQNLYWTDRSGATQRLVEMPMMHLKSAIHLVRVNRIDAMKAAAKIKGQAERSALNARAALACAWLVCMEAEAERRDPTYASLRKLQGHTKATPSPVEIAALPGTFIGQ